MEKLDSRWNVSKAIKGHTQKIDIKLFDTNLTTNFGHTQKIDIKLFDTNLTTNKMFNWNSFL